MHFKEIITHRFRDLDSVFRTERKIKLGLYVLIRQFCKLFNIKEEKFIDLVGKNRTKLFGKKFDTREKTLDFLFISKYYEPETTNFIVNSNGRVFIDVGAHIGRFSILGSDNYKKVYAIEPHPDNFNSLAKNIKINKKENIKAVNLALSNKKGQLFFNELKINTGALKLSETGLQNVNAERLNDLAKNENIKINEVDLILIDVEGHELEVLTGATDILALGNPRIIVESFNPKKIIGFLKKYDYEKKTTFDSYNHLFVKNIKNI